VLVKLWAGPSALEFSGAATQAFGLGWYGVAPLALGFRGCVGVVVSLADVVVLASVKAGLKEPRALSC